MKTECRESGISRDRVDRRTFFKAAGAGALGTLAAGEIRAESETGQLSPEIHGFVENGILKRTLGRTGLKVSAIGLGTIPLFRAPEKQARDVIKKSIDMGINFIDTARYYRDGFSEDRIGEVTPGIRKNLVLLSKSPNRTDKITEDVEKSLKALKTDYIDVYCFHSLDKEDQWEKVLGEKGALEGLKKTQQAGKIGFIGISGHRSDFLTKVISSGEIDVVVTPFNFVFDDGLHDLIPKAKELNVGFAGIKPFAGCFIQHAELSLRWILQQEIDVTVPGMWQLEEVVENTRLLRNPQPLVDTEREFLHEERQVMYYELCRFCNVCKPCPNKVPFLKIVMTPLMLRRQGLALELGERKQKKPLLNAFDKMNDCTECGGCVESCKYHLPIPELMANVKRQYYNPVKYYKI